MKEAFSLELLDIALRAFISIIYLFLITRLMGKKQISQLTFFDYIIGISIGSIAAEMASNAEIPYTHTLVAMGIYALISLCISIITNKSIRARRFFTGHTFYLIYKGKIIEENLSKVHYDVNDLLSEARNSGYFDISEIEYAMLETNGKISFLPKSENQPATLKDLQITKQPASLLANVIIDGKVMKKNLLSIGLDEKWLKESLKVQSAPSISEIMLATIDSDKKLSVFEKTHIKISETPID